MMQTKITKTLFVSLMATKHTDVYYLRSQKQEFLQSISAKRKKYCENRFYNVNPRVATNEMNTV